MSEVALFSLAEKLRDQQGFLTADSVVCMNAGNQLIRLQNRIAELEKVTAMDRIANAIEQAAIHGWGNVPSDNLLQY